MIALSRRSPARTAAIIAGAVILAYLGLHVFRVVRSLGYWGYSIDDAYIHMALASSVRYHGIWGLTRFDAAGASSSPLWTILLAIASVPYWLPIAMNIALAVLSTAWLAAECARRSRDPLIGIALALFAAVISLVAFAVSSGMEHVLHGVLSVIFLRSCLHADRDGARPWLLALWGCLAVACRLESVLVLAIGFLVVAGRRQTVSALAVAAGGLGGLGVYVVVGLWQKIPVVPNSVAMKVLETDGTTLLGRLAANFGNQLGLRSIALVLLIASMFTVVSMIRRRTATNPQVALLIASAVPLLHLIVAKISYVGRYEVYVLMVACAFALPEFASLVEREGAKRLPYLVAGVFVALALLYTRLPSARELIVSEGVALRWSQETDSSQREIARFLDQAAPTGTVLLNDVGAPSFFTRTRVLDLWGLGNNEVCQERLRVGGVVPPEWIESFAKRSDADLAIVFDSWFDGRTFPFFRSPGGGMPKSWTKVGEFRFNSPPAHVLGASVISIYAVRSEDADGMRAKVAAYRPVSPMNTAVAL